MVHVECTKVEGRKAWAEGTIKTLEGSTLAQAKALFVQPKMAKLLAKSTVRAALGGNAEEDMQG